MKAPAAHREITPPVRKGIPVLLVFALMFWGSCALTYSYAPQILNSGKLLLGNLLRNQGASTFDWLPIVIIICAASIVLLCLRMILKHKLSRLCIAIIAALLGVIVSITYASTFMSNQKKCLDIQTQPLTFEVAEDQKIGMYNNSCEGKIISNKLPSYKVKLQFSQDTDEVHAGDILQGQTSFSAATESQISSYWQNGICANAKINNPQKLPRSDPVGWIYAFRNTLIEKIRQADWSKSGEHSEAEQLLSAIVCGQRMDLNQGSLYESFKTAGLAHLVAVSGAHLTLVTAILLMLLKRIKCKKWMQIFFQSVFILCYLICAAIPISALRAAFMAYVALFSFFSKRRPAPLNALGICIIILIALEPQTSVSVSFALSAGSTLGIILFSNLFGYWILKAVPKLPGFINSALSLTFAASICSQPLSVSIFAQLPLIAPVSNIICTPIFSILCGAGLIAGVVSVTVGAILPFIGNAIMWFAYANSWLMSVIVKGLAAIPYACIPATIDIFTAIAVSVFLCCLLWFLWPGTNSLFTRKIKAFFLFLTQEDHSSSLRPSSLHPASSHPSSLKHKQAFLSKTSKSTPNSVESTNKSPPSNMPLIPKIKQKRKRWKYIVAGLPIVVCLVFVFFIFIPSTNQTELIALDIDQGDSIVLRSKGKTFMIDTGNKDNLLKQRLAEEGINHLDGLFITHPDDDHCGSIDVLQSLVVVDNFYCAKDLTACTCKNCTKLMGEAKQLVGDNKIITLNVGDKVCFGEVELNVIWPDRYSDEGGNGDSLCMLANIDVGNDQTIDATALLCGDAEYEQIEEMQKNGRLNNVDIYKVGHHGSKNALSDKSAKTLSPKISLFSVGAKNKYGHPSKSTIDKLESNGSKTFRTDQQGTITCIFNTNSIDIRTQRE